MKRLAEAILMNSHNIGFYEDLTKIIFELSSNMHLISSSMGAFEDKTFREYSVPESHKQA